MGPPYPLTRVQKPEGDIQMSLERRFSVNGTGKEGPETTLPERHRKADQALAERYKRLTQKWGEAEEYFRSLRLPIPIWRK